jgi:hypothetical protein
MMVKRKKRERERERERERVVIEIRIFFSATLVNQNIFLEKNQ